MVMGYMEEELIVMTVVRFKFNPLFFKICYLLNQEEVFILNLANLI